MNRLLPVLIVLAGLGSSISFAQDGIRIVDCFGQPTLHVAQVKGQVFDFLGETIQGVTVSVEKDGETIQETKTDASGRFSFLSVDGTIQLHANSPGFANGYAFIRVERDVSTLIHSGTIYVILGIGMGEPCPSATTSHRELLRVVRDMKKRHKGNQENDATQK